MIALGQKSRNGRVVSSPQAMFDRHVIRSGGCWTWGGSHNVGGYGCARLVCMGGKSVLAHRLSWLVNRGEIPLGMHVLHRCDNRGCVRPDHLFIGTNLDNIADRVAKGRPGSQAFKGKPAPNRRLSEEDVANLVERFASGAKAAELGREFGISREHAWRVGTGRVRARA